MQKTLTIKEQDLHAIVKDLMDKALAIDRPNKEKICRFVVNLVENGGRKADAAMAAGYGAEKDKDGNKRSKEERMAIASSEAHRLLSNDDISAVYESLLSHRFLSTIFVNHLKKEHLASVFYQAGMRSIEDALNSGKKITPGVAALREAGILAGFYDAESQGNPKLIELQEILIDASAHIRAFDKAHTTQRNGSIVVDKEKLN